MAKDGLGTVVGLAAGAGLLWFAYENGWLASFGLGPTAAPAAPAGTSTIQTPATTTTTVGSGAGTNPTPPAPTPPAPPAGPCSASGALARALALAQAANPSAGLGPNGTGTFTMDQWNYYVDQYCTGLSSQAGLIPDAVFPGDANRGGPLNWNAYAGYAAQHGLSGRWRIAGSGAGHQLVRRIA